MDIRKYEPLWGRWAVDTLVGEGSYGSVYRCTRTEFGKDFVSAVKIISIPQKKEEIESARMEGMDDDSVKTYFTGIAEDFIKEIQLMNSLKGLTNVVSIEDYLIEQHDDGIGWDILIRMEYLTSLNQHMKERQLTDADITKIGTDISCAIEQCQKAKVIHRDIKPDNIFVSRYGDFKLGDFGIARQLERTKMSMSQKGTYSYMAPEIYKGQRYDMRVDIYSLGLVLYRLLNNNRLPFLPLYPEAITYRNREDSFARRLAGDEIPPPANCDTALCRIVLKACAFDPDERYQTPGELKAALETINTGNVEVKSEKQVSAPIRTAVAEDTEPEIDETVGLFSVVADEKLVSAQQPKQEYGDKTVGLLSTQTKPEIALNSIQLPKQMQVANKAAKNAMVSGIVGFLIGIAALIISFTVANLAIKFLFVVAGVGFGIDAVHWSKKAKKLNKNSENVGMMTGIAAITQSFLALLIIIVYLLGSLSFTKIQASGSGSESENVLGMVTVPNYVGMDLNEFVTILDNENFTYTYLYVFESDDNVDVIVRQSPAAGIEVMSQTDITLVINKGLSEESVVVDEEADGYQLKVQIINAREAVIRLTDSNLQSEYEVNIVDADYADYWWSVDFGHYQVSITSWSSGGDRTIRSLFQMQSNLWEDGSYVVALPFTVDAQTITWTVIVPNSIENFSFYDFDNYLAGVSTPYTQWQRTFYV